LLFITQYHEVKAEIKIEEALIDLVPLISTYENPAVNSGTVFTDIRSIRQPNSLLLKYHQSE
jgi:hypothetical protein